MTEPATGHTEDGGNNALAATPSWREALWVWCRVALLSFGGPTGQIAVMHRVFVEEKRWVDEQRFLNALNFCLLLPGPEAQQLATYLGWMTHGPRGGWVAGTLFILPGFACILGLSVVYVEFHDLSWIGGVFVGLKPAVIVVVAAALIRVAKRVLRDRAAWWLAAISFAAIHFLGAPFPMLIVGAAAWGWWRNRKAPAASDAVALNGDRSGVTGGWRRSVVLTLWFLPLWLGPLGMLTAWLGRGSIFVEQGLFFGKMACVTFGGAYSVLSYVAQQAVERYGWLSPGEMLDGLGMTETTPGPLIMVVQFVAFMGAYRAPGPFSPLGAGFLASAIAVWVTFIPCFYWIFLGAPHVERLRRDKRLAGTLSAISSAVVGVILNLSLWFAAHTLFARVEAGRAGPLRYLDVDWGTWQPAAFGIMVLAGLWMLAFRRGMAETLAISAAVGIAVGQLGPR
jgi:chromate transporter